jgi:signal transduction histidine kinase
VGRDPLDLLHPSSIDSFSNVIDQVINKEEVTDTIASLITKQGLIIKVLFSWGRLVKYNNGMAVLLSGTEVTEKDRQLKDFEEKNELFTRFMNLVPDGIFIKNKKGECIYRNKFLTDNFSPDTINKLLPETEYGVTLSRYFNLRTTRDKEIFCEVTTFHLNNIGYEGYTGGIILDMSNRIELEKIKEDKNKELYKKGLPETSKEKLFSVIAHDLRSPFHGLLGLTEILANDSDELSKEEIKRIANELHVVFKNQYRILENLLAWARIQDDTIEINPESVNLYQAVNDIVKTLSWTADKKKINISNLVEKDSIINYDPNLLVSILQNILTNAIKFSNEESSIKIEYKVNGDSAALEVTDEGIGLTAEEIDKVLSQDINFTTMGTAREQGTGLGLVICREFISKHGGSLYINSKKNEGTTVGFTILF